jgi:hypothetical protein
VTRHTDVERRERALSVTSDTTVLAIDPGSTYSAFVVYRWGKVVMFGRETNADLLAWLAINRNRNRHNVIEWTAPRGMPASMELFETMWWAGRFAQLLSEPSAVSAGSGPELVLRLQRSAVKRYLCGTSAAKDTNVHAALIDRFGGAGGKEAAVGRKASPGPLYGIVRDVWAALAVAVTYADQPDLAAP